jgi:hypothetical protein
MPDKIYFRQERQRWVVEAARRDGHRDYIGSFRTREDAEAALAIAHKTRETYKTMTRKGGADLTNDAALQSTPIVLRLHGGGELVIDRVSKLMVANYRLTAHTTIDARIPDHDNRSGGSAGQRMTIMSLPRVRFLEKPDPLAADGGKD